MTELSPTKDVIHILRTGVALCYFSKETPSDWPDGHYWISVSDPDKKKVTCEKCLTEFKKARKK